jgi:hypothetical protein
VFSVSLSCKISPRTSTVILRERSPLAIAVATSAMFRTWPVRLLAMKLTLSVRSFHVPPTPGTCACPPSLPSVPTSRATRVTSPANALSWSTIVLMVSLSSRISPFHVDRDFARQIAAGHGRGHLGNVAHLRRQVAGHGVHRVGEILPGAGHAHNHSLAAKFAVRTDFASHARYFGRKRAQLIHHRVDGFFELENFAAHIDRNLAGEIAAGHGRSNFSDVAHLASQVAGHRVDGVREILPRAGHARHLRLAAQFAVGADFARHARYLGGKNAELLNHGVDDVGRAQKLAFERPAIHVQRTVWVRFPWATAAMARVTSAVGRSKSSTSVLTETSISPHAPRAS